MTQHVDSPPELPVKPPTRPRTEQQVPLARRGIVSLLVLLGMLLLLFTGLIVRNVSLGMQPQAQPTMQSTTQLPSPTAAKSAKSTPQPTTTATASTQADTLPLALPGNPTIPQLQLPGDQTLVFEQQDHLYTIASDGSNMHLLTTPGYLYNQGVPPLITPTGQLLYSGNGIWLFDMTGNTAQQIAPLATGQVITSMVLSNDGTQVAWSTEPSNGDGTIALYISPLTVSSGAVPTMVYQQSATACPCFHIFSFLNTTGTLHNAVLLLADDRGDERPVSYGLWTMNLNSTIPTPQPLLNEAPQQGPLLLMPATNTLLYSSFEGVVAEPGDGSVPKDIATLDYADSLVLTNIDSTTQNLGPTHTILSEQPDLSNSADYHWVFSPLFSPDGHTLVYVEFSSDTQAPYDRHSALYTVQMSGSGSHMSVGTPQLLATANSFFVTLGTWLNNQTLTFYSGNAIYAMDIQTGAMAKITQTNGYARVVASIASGQ